MMTLPKHAEIWLPGYTRSRLQQMLRRNSRETVDILFCIADHFEPDHGRASPATQDRRVARWAREYPRFSAFRDADGVPPQHTFFTPLEEYRPDVIEALAGLCARGLGEVEVHLHHGHDTSENLRSRLLWFRDTLSRRHGLLGRLDGDFPVYAFVHGNWALDNSGPDASTCGVNDELTILRETGCYADLTMPAAPEPAQSRTVNALYYAVDDPSAPRSYDYGARVRAGHSVPEGGLMMIQGPLRLKWRDRVYGLCPRIESGTVDAGRLNRLTLERFRQWVSTGIGVVGRPEWIFVKVHSHGAKDANADVMLGADTQAFHRDVLEHFNDGVRYRLHYVTAREMYNIAKAAEAGKSGNAGQYRDYLVRRPPVSAPLTERVAATGTDGAGARERVWRS